MSVKYLTFLVFKRSNLKISRCYSITVFTTRSLSFIASFLGPRDRLFSSSATRGQSLSMGGVRESSRTALTVTGRVSGQSHLPS